MESERRIEVAACVNETMGEEGTEGVSSDRGILGLDLRSFRTGRGPKEMGEGKGFSKGRGEGLLLVKVLESRSTA